MMYSEIPLAHTLISLCKDRDIQHIVLSPGSRNAPLILGFTADPWFTTYSVVDERSAGFFALGLIQQLQKPVLVVCTSGTALVNYYPAVCEAFYSHLPLIVVSADRPSYMIDIGDGQTIRQVGLMDQHVVYSAALKQDLRGSEGRILAEQDSLPPLLRDMEPSRLQKHIQEENEAEIMKAIDKAVFHSGPVHLNLPFEEPLYRFVSEPPVLTATVPPKVRSRKVPAEAIESMAEAWNKAKRKMVLIGVAHPDSIPSDLLHRLSEDPSVVIFTETTSNVHGFDFLTSIDQLIAPIERLDNADELFKELQPEIVMTMGGMLVSKKIKSFLRKFQPEEHWHVGPQRANDTFFILKRHIDAAENDFLRAWIPLLQPLKQEVYKQRILEFKNQRLHRHKEYLATVPFSDFLVYNKVFQYLPESCVLHLSNSSTIRYAQLFDSKPGWKVFCNRGTSGIEGSTSTAVGASMVSKDPVVLLTGDLGFFYDSNGLWSEGLSPTFRVVLINNQGGGIFRILPGDKENPAFGRYLETTHTLQAKGICETFGLNYQRVENPDFLDEALSNHFTYEGGEQRPALLEIITPREVNDKVLQHYFTYLAKETQTV